VNGGWIGFGLTEAGGMKGADIVYYQSSAPSVVTDAYALDFVTPVRDDNQDWTLLTSSSDGGWLTVEVTRALDTQVRKIH
jgi:dopamine beta-monooxygenase